MRVLLLTLVFARLARDLAEDEAVREEDDNERHQVHGEYVEQVVGQLMRSGREEAKRDALRKPGERWVRLDMEDDALHGGREETGEGR